MYYTTNELADLLKYKSRKYLLETLYRNQQVEKGKKNKILSQIWELKIKVGRKWLFKKDGIDSILGGK